MNLKSKDKLFSNLEFAYLIQPDDVMKSDAELYAAVAKHGRAVIRPFDGASLKLKPAVVLTPKEFEEKWQGD